MNNYGNAEPKILKTLNSSGQVLNDSGEVISDTSDYWEKVYNEAEPKPDKILHSDGTIKDSAGNLIQDTTEFNVKKYNQAEPIPAKYLHSDGTINENPGNGGADLENNHQTTIDVSTYTEPVEVVPEIGKDGMKKNTVTLSNIPSGGDKLYSWYDSDSNVRGFAITESVAIGDKLLSKDAPLYSAPELDNYWFTVTAVEEGMVTITDHNSEEYTLTRDAEHDISF